MIMQTEQKKIFFSLFFLLTIVPLTINTAAAEIEQGYERISEKSNLNVFDICDLYCTATDIEEQTMGVTSLMKAAHLNDQEEIIYQLGQNVDINEEDHYGRTAIFFTLERESLDALALLIGADADLRKRTKEGHSILDLALLQLMLKETIVSGKAGRLDLRDEEIFQKERAIVELLFSKGDEETKTRAWQFIASINPHFV
jgi:hypothetical protein